MFLTTFDNKISQFKILTNQSKNDIINIILLVNIIQGKFMKREEKNQQTRRRIMDHALAEFSKHGYGASSVNAICASEDISKGIIYHYFSTKDDLFLACVEECFSMLTEYLKKSIPLTSENPKDQLEKYFTARNKFFQQNPVYQRLFCEATISPPSHLRSEIDAIKYTFDCFNIQTLERLLEPVSLRSQITKKDVIELFRHFQDFINAKYQFADLSTEEFKVLEENRWKALDILLYGVIKRKTEDNLSIYSEKHINELEEKKNNA